MKLFDGDDIIVAAKFAPEPTPLVVAFSSRGGSLGFREDADLDNGRQLDSLQGFLDTTGHSYIYIASKWPHWWQTNEMEILFTQLDEAGLFKRFASITTYGGSMGGYGAFRFARRIGASRVVCVAPQYSVDPAIVPFEHRWAGDRERVNFIDGDPARFLRRDLPVTILYDPLCTIDRRHVQLIERNALVQHWPIAFADHQVAAVLSEVNLLGSSIRALITGEQQLTSLLQNYRTARRSSVIFHANVASKLLTSRRLRFANQIAERACSLAVAELASVATDLSENQKRIAMLRAVQIRADVLTQMGKSKLAESHARRWDQLTDNKEGTIAILRGAICAAQHRVDEAERWFTMAMKRPMPVTTGGGIRNMIALAETVGTQATVRAMSNRHRDYLISNPSLLVRMIALAQKHALPNVVVLYATKGIVVGSGSRRIAIVRARMAALLSVGARKQANIFVTESLSNPEYSEARNVLRRVIMRSSTDNTD